MFLQPINTDDDPVVREEHLGYIVAERLDYSGAELVMSKLVRRYYQHPDKNCPMLVNKLEFVQLRAAKRGTSHCAPLELFYALQGTMDEIFKL